MRLLLTLGALIATLPLHAATLTVEQADGARSWETSQLLAHSQTQTITIHDDVAYKRTMTYRALPIAALLEGITAKDHLQAVATDGFAAELAAAPLLQTSGSRAWLAIEDPAHPWPSLSKGSHSAGPFYLVWTDPQVDNISREEWPYAVSTFRVLASVGERFPAMLPDPALAADDPINQGFTLYQRNCMACHRLNGGGDSQLGPDLNMPFSPTEYFSSGYLRQYIRNPESLRTWPQGKMPAIPEQILPDAELDKVLSYLEHMAGRRND